MSIAFTVCSNNFLAHAKAAMDSLGVHHPEIKRFIVLVDLPDSRIDYSQFSPSELIVANETVIPCFEELLGRYDVIELNCAIRPFVINYLYQRFPGTKKLYYIDPDMFIYDRLEEVEALLEDYDIVVTPHFTEPLPIDGHKPFENLALTYGIYNLGFLAINPSSPNTQRFLEWWGERTRRFGFIDLANGYFTDQIWFNLVPLFFEKAYTVKHQGYNMAAWNLHERSISTYCDTGKIVLSSGAQLAIYHFSSWSYKEPDLLSPYYNRYTFESRPDLLKLYQDYRVRLLENRVDFFSTIPCLLPYYKKTIKRSKVKKVLYPGVNLMRRIWQKI